MAHCARPLPCEQPPFPTLRQGEGSILSQINWQLGLSFKPICDIGCLKNNLHSN
ncbi:MAG: hypothetical protein IJT59_02410 [Desulfovibrionaceae bacterium]|nr:hypothetical protein [Desulfovibrionaceae bacterium]